MRPDLLDILRCPEDKATLDCEVSRFSEGGHIVAGTLTCTKCGFAYPIEDGIPNLLPQDFHVDGVADAELTD